MYSGFGAQGPADGFLVNGTQVGAAQDLVRAGLSLNLLEQRERVLVMARSIGAVAAEAKRRRFEVVAAGQQRAQPELLAFEQSLIEFLPRLVVGLAVDQSLTPVDSAFDGKIPQPLGVGLLRQRLQGVERLARPALFDGEPRQVEFRDPQLLLVLGV